VLSEGFKFLHQIQGANIVLVIGNTGCGKSTMLSSLLKGPDALELKQITYTIEVPNTNGTTVTRQKSKQVIDNKVAADGEDFIIGHSDVNSETFLPKFLYDRDNDILYGDIAGLQDTSGPLVDFINSFLVKKIFQLAQSVRFLFVLTKKQLKDMRGMQIRQQIRVLQGMCASINIKYIHNSIKPVITKMKTGALADDEDERCLEDIRTIFTEACEAEVEMLRNQDQSKDEEIDRINQEDGAGQNTAEAEAHEQAAKDGVERSKEKRYEALFSFYERLASKLVVYDPLNRTILDDDEFDMGTKRDQLIMEINMMEQLNSKDLCVMMSPDRLDLLEDLFEKTEREVKDICDEQMKDAKEKGNQEKGGELGDAKSIKQYDVVVEYLKILEFFVKEDLLADAKARLDNFVAMVDGADEQITRLRSQKTNSILAKLVNEASNTIFIRKRDRNYPALVKELKKLQDNVDSWQKELQKQQNPVDVDKQIKRAQKEIDKCFKELSEQYD
jgi:ABC-type dipeptide/oligopeptide/nickel transport system ATPase component